MRVGWATDPGRVHPTNEDSYAIFHAYHGSVLVVCDGMGGMGRGDEASQLAVRAIYQFLIDSPAQPELALSEALTTADYEIRRRLCSSGRSRPGSTAAIAYLTDKGIYIGWIGDSPIYHVRQTAVVARTRDHKLVEDLVDQGELTPEEAANSSLSSVLTKALGGRPPSAVRIEPSTMPDVWALANGERVVLCSDGLTDLVTGEEIAEVTHELSPADAAHELVRMANNRGGHDNITVIVAEAGGTTPLDVAISNAEIGPWMEDLNDHATDPHGLVVRDTLPPEPHPDDNRTFEFAPPRGVDPSEPEVPIEDGAAEVAIATVLVLIAGALAAAILAS